jgi:hypothetical protein
MIVGPTWRSQTVTLASPGPLAEAGPGQLQGRVFTGLELAAA